MNQHIALRPATALNQSADPRVLGTIAMPGVAVAIWHRTVAPDMQAWLDDLPAARLPRLRQVLRPCDAGVVLAAACDRAGLPEGPQRQALVSDIAELVQLAALHLQSLMVTLRLEISDGQACPKWHLDAVRARLLCTLRGTGTQFGPATGADSVASLHHVPTGSAAMFRGRNWGPEPTGILHRSPPSTGDQARMLVVVDPADEASC
ncbi:DUF1826 domain-containing protein [Paracoccus sp. (in: a-proteobacteria)]|uniref:DUF1826 domain-containing protein n=1 Tax=Paracoccus sp. TaxID=267 RepID=UPI00396C96FB